MASTNSGVKRKFNRDRLASVSGSRDDFMPSTATSASQQLGWRSRLQSFAESGMPRTLTIYLTLLGITQVFCIFVRLTTHGVTYYRFVRIHGIITFEFFMAFGSFLIWKRLSAALKIFEPSTVTLTRFRWKAICLQDVARASLFLFLVLSQMWFLFYFILLGSEPTFLAVVCLTSLALYLHIVVFLMFTELIHFLSRVMKRVKFGETVADYVYSNRDIYSLTAVFCATLFITAGLLSTFTDPVFRHVDIPMHKFSENSTDLKVALLSDIHMGPTVGRHRMETIVRLTNALNPDIIAISGDLADGFVKHLKGAAEPLKNLKANLGVYFATGNHEYMHGSVVEWFELLHDFNITVLHNDQRRVKHGDDTICVAGMDDLYAEKSYFAGHHMDPEKALRGCEKTDTVILLAHQPNAAGIVLRNNTLNDNIDLILSGHTHGGQMYLFMPLVYLANAFTRGLYYYDVTRTYVYVSAGVNFFGPPIKMFGACEIIDITLKHA